MASNLRNKKNNKIVRTGVAKDGLEGKLDDEQEELRKLQKALKAPIVVKEGTTDILNDEREEELLILLLEDEVITELRDKLYRTECYHNKLIDEQIVRLNKNNVTLVPPSSSEPVETKPFLSSTAG